MKRLFTSLVAAVALLLCACGGQAQESPWQTAYRETGQYLLSQPAPTTGSIGGEWAVGSTLLSETWPKGWRKWIAAVLQD